MKNTKKAKKRQSKPAHVKEARLYNTLVHPEEAAKQPSRRALRDDRFEVSSGRTVQVKTLYTIGHSTHPIDEFLELLYTYKIKHLIDVRTIPKSRRVPWFNQDELKKTLADSHVKYTHMKALGGLRHPNKHSINKAWRNDSFRGYADYMQTDAFEEALQALNDTLNGTENTAIMCAEAVPWRCHRGLIADVELTRGIAVYHIISQTACNPHKMTSFAKIDNKHIPPRVFYPEEQISLDLPDE